MDEIVVISNEFLSLLADLGCDLTVVPDNSFDLAVLNMKFQWAVFLVGFGLKFIYKMMGIFMRGV